MIRGTDSSGGTTIWAMNVTDLSEGVYQKMMSDGSDVTGATVAFFTERGQTVTAADLAPVLPDLESSIASRIGTIRDHTVREAEAILSRRPQ